MTAPNTPTREMGAQLADILRRLDDIERGRSTQLGNSSLDASALQVVGPDGTRLASWGYQPDGTASTKHTDPKPLSRPNTPIVTQAVAGLLIEWNGKLIQETPGNFSHVSIHVSPVAGFVASDGNQVGAFREAGVFAAAPLDYVTHYVKLVAWSTSKVSSEPSFEQSGTPGKVVADEVLKGVVGELALAEGAVKEAALAAGAVTSTKVGDDAITTPKLVAGAVQASKLAAGAVTTDKLTADAVTADKIAALAVTTDALAANSVEAGKIAAGSIDATKLAANLVLGSRVIAGTPTGTRVELSASGLIVVRSDGDTTFSVDSSTGDVVSMGEYYTSRFGERIALNSGGLSSPIIRAYPDRGSNYASLGAKTSSTPSGQQVAFWTFRVPYLNPDLVGFVDFVAENSVTKADIPSSKLWYRPYVASGGTIIPGWEAFHQDVSACFSAGGLYVRDKDNLAYRDLLCRSVYGTGRGSFDNVEITGNAIFSKDYDGAVRWAGGAIDGAFDICNRAGTVFKGIRSSNFATTTPSWREMKTGFRDVADYLGTSARAAVDALDVRAFEYDPEHPEVTDELLDGGTHLGPMLDEVPEPIRRHHVLAGDDGVERTTDTWDRDDMLGLALAALQEQSRTIAELTARLDALEGTAA